MSPSGCWRWTETSREVWRLQSAAALCYWQTWTFGRCCLDVNDAACSGPGTFKRCVRFRGCSEQLECFLVVIVNQNKNGPRTTLWMQTCNEKKDNKSLKGPILCRYIFKLNPKNVCGCLCPSLTINSLCDVTEDTNAWGWCSLWLSAEAKNNTWILKVMQMQCSVYTVQSWLQWF